MQIEKRIEKLKKGKAKDSQSKVKVSYYIVVHLSSFIFGLSLMGKLILI